MRPLSKLRALALVLATLAGARSPVAQSPSVLPDSTSTTAGTERIVLTAGRSTVLATDFDITRIAVTNPEVADAVVVQPREILIDGKASGTVSLIAWGVTARRQYDVVVDPGVSILQQQIQALFPGEDIRVSLNDESVILSGLVSSNVVSLRVAEIAEATSQKSSVINLLQLPGGSDSQQVMLQVRFAEVNRRALEELGLNLFTGPTGYKDYIARSTTQQYPAPAFEDLERDEVGGEVTRLAGKITFSDFLNLFVLNTKYNVGAVIRALKSRGYFQSLAEPNLIAYNNQEASFLAGGEFPIPVLQGATGTVTIVFKEFGVRLTFKPTIAGDTIRLKVRPEVSSLDFNNGIVFSGFRIPALTARRAETDVELRDGQSFAIAGLLNNSSQEDRLAVPVLSRIPVIGNLFKSKANRQEQTELMVLITPRLVRPLDPDEVPPLPTQPGSFLKPNDNLLPEKVEGPVDAPPVTRSPNTRPPGRW